VSVSSVNTAAILAGLEAREAAGRPVRVGLIGAGRFGTTVAAQVGQMRGLRLSLVCDLRPESAQMAARGGARGDEARIVRPSGAAGLADAIAADRVAVTDDLALAIEGRPVASTTTSSGASSARARSSVTATRSAAIASASPAAPLGRTIRASSPRAPPRAAICALSGQIGRAHV